MTSLTTYPYFQFWKIFIESDDITSSVDIDKVKELKAKYNWMSDDCSRKAAIVQVLFSYSISIAIFGTYSNIVLDLPFVSTFKVFNTLLIISQMSCPELLEKLNLTNPMWSQVPQDIGFLDKLQLDAFEYVIAAATLCPEYLYRAIISFVDRTLGNK